MKGPGPPPPLGTSPNGVDINQPKYSFDTDEWKKAPKLSNESFRNTDSVVSRDKNDSDYFTIGNQTTWHQYIVLGYHCYDDCFQFETQWERMIQSESDSLTYIWYVYTYHCNTKLEMPTVLQNWAMDIAKPYLEGNYPDRLTPDTNDPRNGRLQYTESDLMDIEEDEEEGKPAAQPEWKLVESRKVKASSSTAKAIATPLPASPKRKISIQTAKGTNPITPTNDTTTFASASVVREPGDFDQPQYSHVNDGTLRITAKWKPQNYEQLSEDQLKWNLAATDMIHYMFQTSLDVTLHSWINETPSRAIPILELNPDNLLSFLAPKITPLPSIKMFIFTFRICMSKGPGKWINNPTTRKALQDHHVEVNVSNSSSDSGDTIETAGYIFFKHPKWTHRHHYLTHLRNQLPTTTPFFDLGYHRKTPTGQAIPHIAVRCGENHVSSLTEILSAYLDGTKTAVFLGRLMISKMPPDEVDCLFKTHSDFVTNIRTLPLAPLVTNIDRLRTEHKSKNSTLERTTREWAASLTDDRGKSLQCDVENGGNNRAVLLLIPKENMPIAIRELRAYKERISPFNQRETDFSERVNLAHPEAIYVPTPTAQNNLTFLQSLSPTTIWSNAPASVRSPTATASKPNSYQAPKFGLQFQKTNQYQPIDLTRKDSENKKSDSSKILNPGQSPVLPNDDTETTATMSQTLGTNHTKFAEMEAHIRSQNQSIRAHQAEFRAVTQRFDTLEGRILTTLEFCKTSSDNVMELRQETTNHILGIRSESAANVAEFRSNFAQMQDMIRQLQETITEAAAHRSDGSCSSRQSTQSDAMSVRTADSKIGLIADYGSPEKKIQKSNSKTRTSRPRGKPTPRVTPPILSASTETADIDEIDDDSSQEMNQDNQDTSAQYNDSTSTPDSGAT